MIYLSCCWGGHFLGVLMASRENLAWNALWQHEQGVGGFKD